MLDARGLRRPAVETTDDLDARARRRRRRADPAPRRRAGGAARDETFPLACGCIGQETTGAGGLAKALRTVPVVLEIADARARARGAGRVDRRLHEPGRDRHARAARRRATARSACATSRSGSSAAFARAARRRAGARRGRPGRPQPPHLGARACGSTASDVLAEPAGASTATSSPTDVELPRALLDELGAVPVVLPALLLRPRRGARRAARRRRRARQTVAGDRARAARAVPRPGARHEARAARAARRRVLQRGRDRRSSPRSSRATATSRCVDVRNDGDARRAWPTTTSSRCPRGSAPDGPVAAAARRRSRPSCSASSSTSPPTSGSRPARRSAGSPPTSARRCSPTR